MTTHIIVAQPFDPDGEGTEARTIWVRYHDIKGSGIEQFRASKTVSILSSPQYKTGDLIGADTKAHGG